MDVGKFSIYIQLNLYSRETLMRGHPLIRGYFLKIVSNLSDIK